MSERILIRAGKEPWVAVSPESNLDFNVLGTNSGNMLFSSAVFATLSTDENELLADYFQVERTSSASSLAGAIAERFDRIVLPFANAFRSSFVPHLNRWTDVVERVGMPVSVLGVGGQFSLEGRPTATPEVDEATTRFMRAVLDRGPSIGVRGPITAEYLAGLGFGDEHVTVTGCPSLYRPDIDVRMRDASVPLPDDARIAFNLTPNPRYEGMEHLVSILEEARSAYGDVVYIPQENQDLAHMLWGTPFTATADRTLPRHAGHWLFTENRSRFFVDERTWREFLSGHDLAVGNRIHGTIASVLAGVPSIVLPFDSRITELAEVHRLPNLPLAQLAAGTTADDLRAAIDAASFNERHRANLDAYRDFLDAHGLRHAFREGAEERYSERVAKAQLPGPVEVAPALVPAPALDRMRWLQERSAPGLPLDLRHRVPGWTPARRADGPARTAGSRLLRIEREMKAASSPTNERTDDSRARTLLARLKRRVTGKR